MIKIIQFIPSPLNESSYSHPSCIHLGSLHLMYATLLFQSKLKISATTFPSKLPLNMLSTSRLSMASPLNLISKTTPNSIKSFKTQDLHFSILSQILFWPLSMKSSLIMKIYLPFKIWLFLINLTTSLAHLIWSISPILTHQPLSKRLKNSKQLGKPSTPWKFPLNSSKNYKPEEYSFCNSAPINWLRGKQQWRWKLSFCKITPWRNSTQTTSC